MAAGVPRNSHFVRELEVFAQEEGYAHVANDIRLNFEANEDSVLRFAVHGEPSEAENLGFSHERVKLHAHAFLRLGESRKRLEKVLRH
jgi:hypothetical protein